MALVDLKRSKADKAEEAQEATGGPAGDDYPYGLCLNIDNDELAKLGVSQLPNVGDEFHITAVAKVTRTSSSASENDESSGMSLQITMMELSAEDSEDEAGERGAAAENAEVSGRVKTVVSNAYRGRGNFPPKPGDGG